MAIRTVTRIQTTSPGTVSRIQTTRPPTINRTIGEAITPQEKAEVQRALIKEAKIPYETSKEEEEFISKRSKGKDPTKDTYKKIEVVHQDGKVIVRFNKITKTHAGRTKRYGVYAARELTYQNGKLTKEITTTPSWGKGKRVRILPTKETNYTTGIRKNYDVRKGTIYRQTTTNVNTGEKTRERFGYKPEKQAEKLKAIDFIRKKGQRVEDVKGYKQRFGDRITKEPQEQKYIYKIGELSASKGFTEKYGKATKELQQRDKEEAIRQGMKETDDTLHYKFKVKKTIVNPGDIRQAPKYPFINRFRRTRNTFIEKRYHRFNKPAERGQGMNIMSFINKRR